jgi:chromosomal replication initiator protein
MRAVQTITTKEPLRYFLRSIRLPLGGMSVNLAPENLGQSSSDVEKSAQYPSLQNSDNHERLLANDDTPSLEQCWAIAIADVCSMTNQHIVAAYIEPLELDIESSTRERIIVRGPSRLICNYVTANFVGKLRDRLDQLLTSHDLILSVIPRENPLTNGALESSAKSLQRPATPFIVKRPRPANNDSSQDIKQVVATTSTNPQPASIPGEVFNNINPRYTFSDFVVGNSNQFCHAAAMRVAEKPGQSYNPLFIYGGVGLGKTHLLHSIGNAVLQRNPHARVLYMSSETFTNELILALRQAKMEEFKRRLRTIEVLLIDDIQFISGKERTQEEFFHTFNALYSAKRQIVITSDKIPTDIPGIEERLQTRFSWGLTADLQAPDFETRVAILKQKALVDEFHLPEEVGHLIAERISSNVRELEGALTRLHAVSSIQNVPISLDMAKTALKPLLQPKVVNISVDDIKRAVAMHFNIKVSDIVSKRRTKNLSFPRHIAMYLCRKHTTASYPEIGEHFGGRDHSSVIHAATVVSSKLSTDTQVKSFVDEIEKKLLG